MAPSNIALRPAYNKNNKRVDFIQGRKYQTKPLVQAKRTTQIVGMAMMQEVGGTKGGYTRKAPTKPTHVKPYFRKFVPRGKEVDLSQHVNRTPS
jgi:hypothetical protein